MQGEVDPLLRDDGDRDGRGGNGENGTAEDPEVRREGVVTNVATGPAREDFENDGENGDSGGQPAPRLEIRPDAQGGDSASPLETSTDS